MAGKGGVGSDHNAQLKKHPLMTIVLGIRLPKCLFFMVVTCIYQYNGTYSFTGWLGAGALARRNCRLNSGGFSE